MKINHANRLWRAAALAVTVNCLGACVPLDYPGGYEGHYPAAHPHEGGTNQPQAGPVIYDISGSWSFNGGNVNRFQRTSNGYYVTPVGRGRAVHYIEIGDNLYQDANSSGTYEVLSSREMLWRSNNKKNTTIHLYR